MSLVDITSNILILIILMNLFAIVVYIWPAFLDPSFRESFFDGIKIIDHNIIFAIPIYFSDAPIIGLAQIAAPSTMLTSAWIILEAVPDP